MSVAESCTGGMLGSVITSVPGSGKYFLGGVVAYSNESKEDVVNVPRMVMIVNGAVSEEAAVHMASGVRSVFNSDVSISITGIAGPDGGTATKPVGLVWIGISTKHGTFAKKFNFEGNREDIRKSAVRKAMGLLLKTIDTGLEF
jgi:PncC family amidohydrolase